MCCAVILAKLRGVQQGIPACALQLAAQGHVDFLHAGQFFLCVACHFKPQKLDGLPRHGSRFAWGAKTLMADA